MEIETIKQWLGTGSINIFGRPFAGKDTQGRLLATLFEGALLGGGDILRNSVIPEHVDEKLRRGELAPTEDYISIVLPYLSREEFEGKPLILSSVGRWIGEEQGVIKATAAAGHELRAVVHVEVSEQHIYKRWEALEHHDDRGKRYDDTLEILKKRLEEYRLKTLPVIAEYDKRGLLVTVNGEQPSEAVHHDIIQGLQQFIARNA